VAKHLWDAPAQIVGRALSVEIKRECFQQGGLLWGLRCDGNKKPPDLAAGGLMWYNITARALRRLGHSLGLYEAARRFRRQR